MKRMAARMQHFLASGPNFARTSNAGTALPGRQISSNVVVRAAVKEAAVKEAAPKKAKAPPSTYARFIKAAYPEAQKKNPSMGLPEISKMLAAQWKSTPDAAKKSYEEDYKKDKAVWDATREPAPVKAKKAKAPGSGSGKLTGYQVYMSETVSPELPFAEAAKKWKSKSDAEKAKFKAKADTRNGA